MLSHPCRLGLLTAASCCALAAAEPVSAARFGADFLSGRASVLIIGDSTNNPRGAGNFVPYYEAILRELPVGTPVCGFRVSGSTGNTAVNHYVRFAGGSTGQMVEGGIRPKTPSAPVTGSAYAPPGYRNQFQIVPGGSLPSTRFIAMGMTNFDEISPAAVRAWAGEDVTIRTPFVVSPDGTTLPRLSMRLLSDHEGLAGNAVHAFSAAPLRDLDLPRTHWGLHAVDAEFASPQTTRIGVQFGGDSDADDADEGGRVVSWCDHIVFSPAYRGTDRGLYLDSVSIGGFSAFDHAATLGTESLAAYMKMAPRPANWVMVWLGQNTEIDEWNGSMLPAFAERIEAIADTAIAAAAHAGQPEPSVVLVVPPLASGSHPARRFTAMGEACADLAHARGWEVVDLHAWVGSSLRDVDEAFTGDGVHPSLPGATHVARVLLDGLACSRADFDGDGRRTAYDLIGFVSAFASSAPGADLTGDGVVNVFDLIAFLDEYARDCPAWD